MKSLPSNVVAYKKTPVFTSESVPAALLRQHTTKVDSWAKIWVKSGQLKYQILHNPTEEYTLTPDLPGIVEPQVSHQVKPLGPVEFYVEFYHAKDQSLT